MNTQKSAFFASSILLAGFLFHGQVAAQQVGQITNLEGDVRIERGQENLKAKLNDPVNGLDRVVTGKGANAGIVMNDKTRIAVGANSSVLVAKFAFNPTTNDGSMALNIFRGTLGVITGLLGSKTSNEVQVITPTTTAGVRGTQFLVEVKQ